MVGVAFVVGEEFDQAGLGARGAVVDREVCRTAFEDRAGVAEHTRWQVDRQIPSDFRQTGIGQADFGLEIRVPAGLGI